MSANILNTKIHQLIAFAKHSGENLQLLPLATQITCRLFTLLSTRLQTKATQHTIKGSNSIDLHTSQNILAILGAGGYGDMIFRAAVLQTLKDHFPHIDIDVACHMKSTRVFQNNPCINTIRSFTDSGPNTNLISHTDSNILPTSYDSVVTFHYSGISFPADNLYRRLFNHNTPQYKRIPIADSDAARDQEALSDSVTRKLFQDSNHTYHSKKRTPLLHLSKEEQEWALEKKWLLLDKEGVEISEDDLLVGIVIGAADPFRNYHDRSEVIQEVGRQNPTAKIVLIGSPDAILLANSIIADKSSPSIINLVGKTTMREAACIFSSLDLVIATDSGGGNTAYALGTVPVVMIYSRVPKHLRIPNNAFHVLGLQTQCNSGHPHGACFNHKNVFKIDESNSPASSTQHACTCMKSLSPQLIAHEALAFMYEFKGTLEKANSENETTTSA